MSEREGVSLLERASVVAFGRIRLRYGVEWAPCLPARDGRADTQLSAV